MVTLLEAEAPLESYTVTVKVTLPELAILLRIYSVLPVVVFKPSPDIA